MRFPKSRGPISSALLRHLERAPHSFSASLAAVDRPLDDQDLHLALAVAYEISNGGVDGVDDAWEHEPSFVAYRGGMERQFENALRSLVPVRAPQRDIASQLRALIDADRAPSLSSYLAQHGTPEQFREFVIHRSFYQLREADPHTWAIPRLRGKAKAAMVMVQNDEYGGGVEEQMHSSLFRRTMRAFDLDTEEGAYLDALPGTTLATVNLMHLFALHRRRRGAIVGHLALFEMTSTEPNQRYGDGMRRLGFGPDATKFFDEHVTADAVHEVIAANDLACSLAAESPSIAADILFGAETLLALEGRFAGALLSCWEAGRSSLCVSEATQVGELQNIGA